MASNVTDFAVGHQVWAHVCGVRRILDVSNVIVFARVENQFTVFQIVPLVPTVLAVFYLFHEIIFGLQLG